MTRTFCIALLLAVGLATAASAAAPPVIWFSDNFNSYTNNTRLRLVDAGTPWATNSVGTLLSTGPENYVLSDYSYEAGGKAVRLKGSSGAGTASSTYTNLGFGSLSASTLVVLHFRILPDPAYGNEYTVDHGGVYMVDASGVNIGGWSGSCYRMKTKWNPLGGAEGAQVNFTDNLWHDFDITYDPGTGVTQWYRDGVLIDTQNLTAGRAVAEILVYDSGNQVSNYLWLDDLAIGTVPEPCSLLILGMGLVGLAAHRRRR